MQHIKHELHLEFMRRYSTVDEEDFLFRCTYGNHVFQCISTLLIDISFLSIVGDNPNAAQNFESCPFDEDERISRCSNAINRSKRLADILFISPYNRFTLREKNSVLSRIKKEELVFTQHSEELSRVKNQLMEFLVEIKPSCQHIRTMLIEYLQAMIEQFQCLIRFYTIEIEVGNRFVDFFSDFVETHFSRIQSRLNPKTVNEILTIFHTMRRNYEMDLHGIKTVNFAMLKLIVGRFEDDLQERRNQLDALQTAMSLLEQIVSELDGSVTTTPACVCSSQKMASTSNSAGNGMAFILRWFQGFKRRK
ncbi:MAG: hypothetical protein C4527_00450 [Candidatus Omnitrophota bacterium]|nr:MAG: hypothetical protein C4527_00450 [Candidatus Omnitrophota bacterium]